MRRNYFILYERSSTFCTHARKNTHTNTWLHEMKYTYYYSVVMMVCSWLEPKRLSIKFLLLLLKRWLETNFMVIVYGQFFLIELQLLFVFLFACECLSVVQIRAKTNYLEIATTIFSWLFFLQFSILSLPYIYGNWR